MLITDCKVDAWMHMDMQADGLINRAIGTRTHNSYQLINKIKIIDKQYIDRTTITTLIVINNNYNNFVTES